MAKKQRNIPKEQLKQFEKSDTFLNLVMANQAVYVAKVISIDSDKVKVKNTKGHVLLLSFDQIVEIWKEEKVA